MKKIITILWIGGVLFQIYLCMKMQNSSSEVDQSLRMIFLSLISAVPATVGFIVFSLRKYMAKKEEDGLLRLTLPLISWFLGFLPIFLAVKTTVKPSAMFIVIGITSFVLIFGWGVLQTIARKT